MSELSYTDVPPLPAEHVEPLLLLQPRPRRRGPRPGRRATWGWALMLTCALVAVPLGIVSRGELGAGTAVAGTGTRVIDDGPFESEWPMQVTVRVANSERSGPLLNLGDGSLALGSPNGGRLVGGVRLPIVGDGFYTYDPASQHAPQSPDRRWGTASLVDQLISLGGWWAREHPDGARLGFGDLSLQHGGHFGGPGVGHSSHQNGLDVDIRLPRRDGVEGPANPATYDRELTQRVVDRLIAQGASLVLIGPSLDLTGPPGVVVRWPNHDDHLHARFPDPDGTGN